MEWFEKWFNKLYLELYSHRNEKDAKAQISLIFKTLNISKSDYILDLACGEGRHCNIISNLGYNIKGIDLSESLIESGKKKYPHIDIEQGDMRKIKGKFDVILSLFTSFGYFETDEENLSVLLSVSNALKENGYYWLDFLNPLFVRKNLIPFSKKTLKNGTTAFEKRKIINKFVIKEIEFSTGEKFIERVKLYEKDELIQMFFKVGIKPIGFFGDYSGLTWNNNSQRTIIYGQKIT
jgi:2-polyprenyl-3-methyl-5-hydroxy-6-metoxy-1,4-benzoquinol methylase